MSIVYPILFIAGALFALTCIALRHLFFGPKESEEINYEDEI